MIILKENEFHKNENERVMRENEFQFFLMIYATFKNELDF